MEDMIEKIKKGIGESIKVKNELLSDEAVLNDIKLVILKVVSAYNEKRKVLFCGNGGSAADAQHLAAELSGRYYFDRPPLNAEALHVNASYLTAVANDYSYEEIYSRYLKGVGNKGDVLFAFSTSGNSKNVIKAIEYARSVGIYVVGFTGSDGGGMASLCDAVFKVPSNDTARIQESHIMLGHLICEQIESLMFNER
jgi:D-sedoheptulose 7-phosphate isomerase